MKVVSVVGALPQFIKAAPVGKALRAADHTEVLVHTGKHYDDGMSAAPFKEQERQRIESLSSCSKSTAWG